MTNSFRNNNNMLSKREIEVLDLLVQGMSNKQIALQIGISEKTAEKHITNIYHKIGVASRAGAIRWALEQGNNGSRVSPHEESRDFPHSKEDETLLRSRQERRLSR